MLNNIALKELINIFFGLERDFELLNFEINGVKVWQYQRQRIFLDLTKQLGLFKQAHTKKNSFLDLLKVSGSLFYYSLFSNPLSGKYIKEILIFNAGRKMNVDGELLDIYTQYFIKDEQFKSYEIIEELIENRHLGKRRPNAKHQDYQQVRTFIKSYFSSFQFNTEQKKRINDIEKEIEKTIGVEFKLEKLLRNAYLNFKCDYEFYTRLLTKRKPSKVFLVCSYTYKKALIAAAKNLGVETIELQHGTIDQYHMGYNYPGQEKVDYFPDKLYVFGEYWKQAIDFPIPPENIIIKGFPYFNKQYEKFKSIDKVKRQITIISQGTIGVSMSEQFVNTFEKLGGYKIFYKLHPGEYSRWEKDYKELVELKNNSNLLIIDNNDQNLYYYLQSSEYVIGVYSTAIYEALAFNCKVILLNLPGIEYMTKLVSSKMVTLVDNFSEVPETLKISKTKSFPTEFFFST